MPDIKKIKVGETIYDIRDAGAARPADVTAALEEAKTITDALESDLGELSQRTSVIEETVEGIESNLGLKANASDVYAKTETYSSTIIDAKAAQKLDIAPNGSTPLINNNNKINLTYIPDSILGQLVFGGLARPVYYAGANDEYIEFTFSDDAVTKLELSSSSQTLRLQDIDLSKWKGLYFVVAKLSSDTTSTWEVKTNAYGGIISLTVGDWLLSTGTSWEKVDNTDAVQSVAGKTGAVTLAVADINGLRDELDVKVPFTKYPDSTSVIHTFSDNENNVALSLEDVDKSKPKYFFKAFSDQSTGKLENFYIQYYQGAETGIYETALAIEKNPKFNEMQLSFNPVKEEVLCELNPEYVDNGGIYYYQNNDSCIINVYAHVKNCLEAWTDNETTPHGYHIATLPAGINTFGAYYGTVVAQADGTPCPGQTYLIKVIGNKVYLVTKGYAITDSWLIGSVFFFKIHS